MDQQTAEKVLADIVAQWDKHHEKAHGKKADDKLALELAEELVKRLGLTDRYTFYDQVRRRVNRPLITKESDILSYLHSTWSGKIHEEKERGVAS